jgi:hypothetical protein
MTIIIAGAGMAGLLAANMLARQKPKIIESQPTLPNNHSAVLRFRSSIIGDTLNIPFKKVQMIKDVLFWQNGIADALAYSYKNTGTYRSDRSIITSHGAEQRYIAPPHLIESMAAGLDIEFSTPFLSTIYGYIISTIPMPTLMQLLDYPDPPQFNYSYGTNARGKIINCEAYLSLLVPDPQYKFSRISITGDELIVECPRQEVNTVDVLQAIELLGLQPNNVVDVTITEQKYSKITPINGDVRKHFIWWATDKHNIYSLGRYATWRPQLLLDDLVNDVRLIERWINDRYALVKHRGA